MKCKPGIILLLAFTYAAAAHADVDDRRFVEVTGVGIVTQSPDLAHISFGMETQDQVAEHAAKQNKTQMSKLITTLKRLGIQSEDIQTQHYNVSPRYPDRRRETENLEPIGYVVANTVRVTVRQLDRVGQTIDKAISAGASRVQHVTFDLSDPTHLRKQALKLAVENARSEAEALLDSTGGKLGPALRIQTQGGHHVAKSERMMMGAARLDTPVEPGLLETRAHVVIAFEILEPK